MKKLLLKLSKIPKKRGIYIFRDSKKDVILIGRTDNLFDHLFKYFTSSGFNDKAKFIRSKIEDFEIEEIQGNYDSFRRELDLLKIYYPVFNQRQKDSKKNRFLSFTHQDKYPRIVLSKILLDNEINQFIGAFAKRGYIKKGLLFALNHFEIADCNVELFNGVKHQSVEFCIRRKTKQCLRPCESDVSMNEYEARVDKFVKLFSLRDKTLLKEFDDKMYQLAENQEYEKANYYKKGISDLKRCLGQKPA